MVIGLILDDAPEVGTLISVYILSGANIDAALGVRRRRIEDRRGDGACQWTEWTTAKRIKGLARWKE